VTEISRDRAERIAKAHPCVRCRERSYKTLRLRTPLPAHRETFGEVWHAVLECGVCGTQQELGIDAEGSIVYVA